MPGERVSVPTASVALLAVPCTPPSVLLPANHATLWCTAACLTAVWLPLPSGGWGAGSASWTACGRASCAAEGAWRGSNAAAEAAAAAGGAWSLRARGAAHAAASASSEFTGAPCGWVAGWVAGWLGQELCVRRQICSCPPALCCAGWHCVRHKLEQLAQLPGWLAGRHKRIVASLVLP